MCQSTKQLKLNIRRSDGKHFLNRLGALAEDAHQLGLRLGEHLLKLQNGELRVLLHVTAVVGVHHHHLLMIRQQCSNSKRKQLVEDGLPRLLLQQIGKGRHLLHRNLLLLLEVHAAAGAEGVLLRNPQVDQQQRRDVNGRGDKRVLRRTLHHLLCITHMKCDNRKEGGVMGAEVHHIAERELTAAAEVGQRVFALLFHPVQNRYLESQVLPLLANQFGKRGIREGVPVKHQQGLLGFGGLLIENSLRLVGQASDLVKLWISRTYWRTPASR